MAAPSLSMALFELLRERTLDCKYPSPTMLDRVEIAMPDQETGEELARTLIDRLSEERFPSPMMLDRVRDLIERISYA